MMRGKKFKNNRTHSGTMKTKVTFSRTVVSKDFFSWDESEKEGYTSWAEVYDVTNQDLEDLKGRFSKNALALESIKSIAVSSLLTVKIRDPLGSYQPTNSDKAVLHDSRYAGREWEIIDFRPDFYNRHYLVIHLKGL